MNLTKICGKCGREKGVDEFYSDRGKKDGKASQCGDCMREARRSYRQSNLEKERERNLRRYYEKHELNLSRRRRYYRSNIEMERERQRHWRTKNRGLYLEGMRRCYHRNPRKYVAQEAARRATKVRATPHWLTEEHSREIQAIYNTCPAGCHVDHIVPLVSEVVCGLHVPWNLQILTAEENRAKSNRLA